MTTQAEAADTAVRRRTRAAILGAAVTVWARDFGSPVSDIADHAGVSRSTLHRYFPDRQALIDQAFDAAYEEIQAASVLATKQATTAREELEGHIRASVQTGDAILFLFSDPNRFASREGVHGDPYADPESLELIRRAQDEGSVDPGLDPQWVLGTFYSLVYLAAEMVATGALPVHRAGDLAARTLFAGVSP